VVARGDDEAVEVQNLALERLDKARAAIQDWLRKVGTTFNEWLTCALETEDRASN